MARTLKEGDAAPAFDIPTDGGGQARLADYRGANLVLYFYPKDDTPGCTNEAQQFSAAIGRFQRAGAKILGVSRDSVVRHEKFKAKHDLKIVLGSDEDGAVVKAYGVWVEKTLYGRKYMGIERATFLIDGQGVIRRVWRNVKTKGHAEAVLEAVKSL